MAISHSPFGHGRVRVFDSVDEASPASRDSFARLVPRLCKAAMMSAGCQSLVVDFFIGFLFLTVINHAILEYCSKCNQNSSNT